MVSKYKSNYKTPLSNDKTEKIEDGNIDNLFMAASNSLNDYFQRREWEKTEMRLAKKKLE